MNLTPEPRRFPAARVRNRNTYYQQRRIQKLKDRCKSAKEARWFNFYSQYLTENLSRAGRLAGASLHKEAGEKWRTFSDAEKQLYSTLVVGSGK